MTKQQILATLKKIINENGCVKLYRKNEVVGYISLRANKEETIQDIIDKIELEKDPYIKEFNLYITFENGTCYYHFDNVKEYYK